MQLEYRVGDRLLDERGLFEVETLASNRFGGRAVRLRRVGSELGTPSRVWHTPRLTGHRSAVIDRQSLSDLVHAFYDRVRADPELGPVFEEKLADRWGPHLEKMVRFWASVLLGEGSFDGAPMPKHRALERGRPEHFRRWLQLFHETLAAQYSDAVAAIVAARALQMARGLSTGMFGVPFDSFEDTPCSSPDSPTTPSA